MTAAVTDFDPPGDGWTTDDLDELPADGHRRELIDGVLIVSPSPTSVHQIIAARLMVALESSCPAQFEVIQGVEVRVNRRRSLIPDVLVTTDEAARRCGAKYAPHEVVLVAEIVSPGSVTLDRVAKPALYAQAGIPYYWRIETEDGLTVYAYRLDPVAELYREIGLFDVAIDLAEPWPIKVPLARLSPRHFPGPARPRPSSA